MSSVPLTKSARREASDGTGVLKPTQLWYFFNFFLPEPTMKRLVAIVLVILTTSQAINAENHDDHDQQHHKKDQLGFFVIFISFCIFQSCNDFLPSIGLAGQAKYWLVFSNNRWWQRSKSEGAIEFKRHNHGNATKCKSAERFLWYARQERLRHAGSREASPLRSSTGSIFETN